MSSLRGSPEFYVKNLDEICRNFTFLGWNTQSLHITFTIAEQQLAHMDLLALPESGTATIIAGIAILIAGYLIKFQGWTFLLAGHNPDNVSDEDALADLAGGTVLRVGIVVLILGGLIATGLATPILKIVVGIAVVIMIARYIYRAREYVN